MNVSRSLARDTRDPEQRWRLEELAGDVATEIHPTTPEISPAQHIDRRQLIAVDWESLPSVPTAQRAGNSSARQSENAMYERRSASGDRDPFPRWQVVRRRKPMQEGSTVPSLRCENRYQIEDPQAVHASVAVPTADGEPLVYEGLLSDLSLSGLRLILPEKLLQGQHVTVRLTLPSIDTDVTCEAEICWTEPRDGESWWVGCSLDERLGGETLDRMAEANVIDRRRDIRYPTSRSAQVRWELSDDVLSVQIVNYSKGGFCMVCGEQTSSPRDRVMLLVAKDDQLVKIPARVMWQKPTKDGHAFGCSFTTRDGFVRLCEVVEPDWPMRKRDLSGATRPRCGLSRWVIMAVAILLTAEFLELVGVQPQLWQTVRTTFAANVVQPIKDGVSRAWRGEAEDDRAPPRD